MAPFYGMCVPGFTGDSLRVNCSENISDTKHCQPSIESNTRSGQWLNSAGTGRNGVPPPVFGVPPPKVVVPPPGNDVPSPFGKDH